MCFPHRLATRVDGLLISLALVSLISQAGFFSSYLVHNKALWSQAFLAETVETGNKSRCVTEVTHVLRRKLRQD